MKHFYSILILAVLALCTVSCDNDDDRNITFFTGDEPIYQVGTCDNLISYVKLYTIAPEGRIIGVDGGDGDYSIVSNSNEAIVTARMTTPDKYARILLTPADAKEMGEAAIVVSDGNGKVALLKVRVGEYGMKLQVKERGIIVTGEVSDEKKDEIMAAMENTFPVGIDGGFTLSSDTYGNMEEGKLGVYIESFDETPIEGKYIWREVMADEQQKRGFIFKYGNKEYVYLMSIAGGLDTRSIGNSAIPLIEDVTSECTVECPAGVKVYRMLRALVLDL